MNAHPSARRARTVLAPAGPLMSFTVAVAVAVAVVALSQAGCSSSHGTVGVSGTVTYKGKPVTGEVHFAPENASGEARAATGKLDDSGHFTLSTYESGDGAKPGKYLVTIISRGPDKPIPEKKKRLMMEEDAQGNGDPLIPPRYFDPITSGLISEVKESGGNVFTYELRD